METIVKAKKWGNSIGILIPQEIVKGESITLEDELIVHIEKKNDKEKKKRMKEAYIEMYDDLKNISKEWESVDLDW